VKRVVLDASALITLYEGRPGADKVEEFLGGAIEGKTELLMSVVNWGEVYYTVWRGRGELAARKVLAELAQLPIEIVAADMELTRLAAEFRALTKLPYPDCFAAALAKNRKGALATSDPDFSAVRHEVHLLRI
jgi:predicted nucleic acid-binding protein